jgi:hypothetical protein
MPSAIVWKGHLICKSGKEVTMELLRADKRSKRTHGNEGTPTLLFGDSTVSFVENQHILVCNDKLITADVLSTDGTWEGDSVGLFLRVWDLFTRTLEHTALFSYDNHPCNADDDDTVVQRMCKWRDKLLIVLGDDNYCQNELQIWNRETWTVERSIDLRAIVPAAHTRGWDGIYYGNFIVVEKTFRTDDRLLVEMEDKLAMFSLEPFEFDRTLPIPHYDVVGETYTGQVGISAGTTMCEHLLVLASNDQPILGIWDTRDWTFVHMFKTAAADWLPSLTTWGDKVVGHTCRGEMHVWDILDRSYLGYKMPSQGDSSGDTSGDSSGDCARPMLGKGHVQIAGTWDDKLVVVAPLSNSTLKDERVWALTHASVDATMTDEGAGAAGRRNSRISLPCHCFASHTPKAMAHR